MSTLEGTYDAMFEQNLIAHWVYYLGGHVTQPQNWDEILGMLEQPRLFISHQYGESRQAKTEDLNEREVLRMNFPLAEGTSPSYSYGGYFTQSDGTHYCQGIIRHSRWGGSQ